MRNSRYTDQEIQQAVCQAEAGAPVAEIAQQLGVSEATFYAWKKRIAVLGTPEVAHLRNENARLNSLIADLSSERYACKPCAEKRGPERHSS
jgi:putative transposase